MFIEWIDRKHSLGIPVIDEQHKQLFHLTNLLYEASLEKEGQKPIIGIFKKLYAYTRYHFSSEEGMFRQYGFPEQKKHREIHKGFTDRIRNFLDTYRQKPNQPLSEPLDYLVNWIVKHVMGEDRTYADFYRKKGIQPEVYFAPNGGGVTEEARELWRQKKLAMEIGSIDHQHKQLVFILQQFNDLQRGSEQRKRVFTPSFIKKLFYYSQYHFSLEEELMAKHGFPLFNEHRELHKDFILRIQDFAREFSLGKETLNDEIILFLREWTLEHIIQEDGKFKHFVQQNQLKIE